MRLPNLTTKGAAAWLLIAATSIAGCQPGNKFVPPPPPKVTVARPIEHPVAETIEFTGNTRASATVEIRPRINGYLDQVKFEDGTFVEKGDLLFLIEPMPFQVQLDQANAELKRAEASLQLADADFARAKELSQRNVIAQADFDSKEAQLQIGQAGVEAAKAAVKQATLNLSYTKVLAPMSGRIGRHLVDAGNLVYAEMTVLAEIQSIDPIYAYFNVSESDLLRFLTLRAAERPDPQRKPLVLDLALADSGDFSYQGQLDFLELGVDPATGTAVRRGLFPNDDHSLVPGLFVRIRTQIASPRPKLMVPDRAIATDQRGDYVLVVNNENTVESRHVELGVALSGMRVVERGISGDDRVVINGLQRARPGTNVDPQVTELTMADAEDAQAMNGAAPQAPLAGAPQDTVPPSTAKKSN